MQHPADALSTDPPMDTVTGDSEMSVIERLVTSHDEWCPVVHWVLLEHAPGSPLKTTILFATASLYNVPTSAKERERKGRTVVLWEGDGVGGSEGDVEGEDEDMLGCIDGAVLGVSLGRALGHVDTLGVSEGKKLGAFDHEGVPEGSADDTLG